MHLHEGPRELTAGMKVLLCIPTGAFPDLLACSAVSVPDHHLLNHSGEAEDTDFRGSRTGKVKDNAELPRAASKGRKEDTKEG